MRQVDDEAGAWSERALRELAGTRRGHIERLLRRFGVPEADVPDARQQVLLVAWRKLGGLRERESLESWLFTLCRRVARDERRRAYRGRERLLGSCAAPALPAGAGARGADDPERRALARERLHWVRRKCDTELTPEQREAVLSCALEEGSARALAPKLGCAPKTVFSRLYAGRERLRAALGRAGLAAVLPLPWLRRLLSATMPKALAGASLGAALLLLAWPPASRPAGRLAPPAPAAQQARFVPFTQLAAARPPSTPAATARVATPATAPGTLVMVFDVLDIAQPELGIRLQQVSTLEFEPLFLADGTPPAQDEQPMGPSTYPVLRKPRLVGTYAP